MKGAFWVVWEHGDFEDGTIPDVIIFCGWLIGSHFLSDEERRSEDLLVYQDTGGCTICQCTYGIHIHIGSNEHVREITLARLLRL
jgi:hypothetical protein